MDGQEITVPRGTSLLHAAESIGTEVPHYCYHPGLSAPAQCRICLVEVEGAPKLQPSCVTMAADGQVVHTDSPAARRMRQGVLEFYLVNHPLDCPICDMSGECKLQDYVFDEGREQGRGREPKRVFGRDDFGGDVLYYGDRCVMCTRCVRFMDEVARDSRLTVVERGSRAVIDTFFDRGLEGATFAGNVVDICPVGALVSKDFLHKARAWDLDHTPSVCPNCSHGCNIELHTRDNLVQRLKPRENQEVNGHWNVRLRARELRVAEPARPPGGAGGRPRIGQAGGGLEGSAGAALRAPPGRRGRCRAGGIGDMLERGAGRPGGAGGRGAWRGGWACVPFAPGPRRSPPARIPATGAPPRSGPQQRRCRAARLRARRQRRRPGWTGRRGGTRRGRHRAGR